jgi:hypothetical protein
VSPFDAFCDNFFSFFFAVLGVIDFALKISYFLEYSIVDIDLCFKYDSTYEFLYISAIMSSDQNFTFSLMIDYSSLPDGNNLDSNQDSIKFYSFNCDMENLDYPVP